jgi:tetratricopeptide (TPR) repeat protein
MAAVRIRDGRGLLLVFLLNVWATPSIASQGLDTANRAKQEKATELFAQGQRLEALPLLEEVVKANPKDDAMLVALAASLVDHAATLANQEVAGKERLRARGLLDQAWDLGNRSPLALNLSELLRHLPASGAIQFSDKPQVEGLMRAGEAAFSRRDFVEAVRNYMKALELEPTNYAAALFIGNAYHKQNQFTEGAAWYERAIQLDPNVETAYRYYADMLAMEGDMAKARRMLIQAAVAEPYNRMVWRELGAWANLNGTHVNEVYIAVPPAPEDLPTGNPHSPAVASVWRAYRKARANWQSGGRFAQRFPEEKEKRHSLAEESEALGAAADALENLKAEAKIEELATRDQSLSLLLKLRQAGLIEAYVLFSLGDSGIARDYGVYRTKNRNKLEEYMDKFVVPPLRDSTPTVPWRVGPG